MDAITITDLLTKNTDELADIIDNVSPPADDAYVQDRIMSPMKDMAIAMFGGTGYKYINGGNKDPNYDDLQYLLSNYVSTDTIGTSIDLAILIKKQLSDEFMTISDNRANTIISSLTKDNFYIILTCSETTQMYFKDITLKIDDRVSLINCVIDNCILESTGTVHLYNSNINNCSFDVNNLFIHDLNYLYNNKIKAESSIEFDTDYTNSKMLNCYVNKIPINEENNLTPEFVTYSENL